MREMILRNYRSNPSNLNFYKVEKEYNSWLKGNSISILQKFPALSKNLSDDLINEGLISIHKSTRRFMWMCKKCGNAFLQKSDLDKHAKESHSIRGNVTLVQLAHFTECSVRLSMRRTAIRMIKPEIISDFNNIKTEWCEDQISSQIIIKNAENKMTADAKVILNYIFSLNRPKIITKHKKECEEIKNLLSDLLHRG